MHNTLTTRALGGLLATSLLLVAYADAAADLESGCSAVAASASDRIRYVRVLRTPVLDSPQGKVIAYLCRATAVSCSNQDAPDLAVTIDGWCQTRCIEPAEGYAGTNACRLTEECPLTDGPVWATWGGTPSQGAQIGKLLAGATVRCGVREPENTKLRLSGWICADSLTSDPTRITIPERCVYLNVQGDGDSTRFSGVIRMSSPWWDWARFRILVYDSCGMRLCEKHFSVQYDSEEAELQPPWHFRVTLPISPRGFATYRLTTPGSGIMAAFR
jgi:hypothetical protein